jgi:hypothetical protein
MVRISSIMVRTGRGNSVISLTLLCLLDILPISDEYGVTGLALLMSRLGHRHVTILCI